MGAKRTRMQQYPDGFGRKYAPNALTYGILVREKALRSCFTATSLGPSPKLASTPVARSTTKTSRGCSPPSASVLLICDPPRSKPDTSAGAGRLLPYRALLLSRLENPYKLAQVKHKIYFIHPLPLCSGRIQDKISHARACVDSN